MKKQLIIILTVLLMAVCLSSAVSAQENGELLGDELSTTSEIPLPDPYNTRTQKSYLTIQEAIDDPLTLDGDTIQVEPGTYIEHVIVYKMLHIVATGPDTIVSGSFNITSTGNGSIIEGFIINSSGSEVWYGIIAFLVYIF
ncbi:MAG: hypothetical protein KKF16_00225 [Euryarchaeota archaeon]|nr:hypothetical protein [Euryarchaeota archaeon]MBU4607736.1 hypothetical protein [Euryarchaeota archaeon]MBV1729610.1 hypothetical protein [Methanobacterium sp.]MBV1755086.1 hypothetical protein [Methanobacterium sp.]